MPLDDGFWEDERKRLLAILRPRFDAIAQLGVMAGVQQLNQVGITLDLLMGNVAASHWARGHTDALLELLGTTNKRVVGEAVAAWAETPGATMGDLVGGLERYFGEARANTIAVTETTRAFAHGNAVAFDQAGIKEWRWNTTVDDLVCKICMPLHRKVVRIGDPFGELDGVTFTSPPAHPNCRCTVSPVVQTGERQ